MIRHGAKHAIVRLLGDNGIVIGIARLGRLQLAVLCQHRLGEQSNRLSMHQRPVPND